MTLLAMETGGDWAVLVLANELDSRVEAVTVFEGRRSLSRRLIPAVDALLAQNGLTLQDLKAIAVGIGPGSFTGVRVGVTTARTLAQVTGLPLIGIPSQDAYAVRIVDGNPDMIVVVALPSRADELYVAVYEGSSEPSHPPYAAAPAEVARQIVEYDQWKSTIVAGRPDLLPDDLQIARFRFDWSPPEGLAALASAHFVAADFDDPMTLAPAYVVPPAISAPRDRGANMGGA